MNGTVSKTVVAPVATVGSNPTLSAITQHRRSDSWWASHGAQVRNGSTVDLVLSMAAKSTIAAKEHGEQRVSGKLGQELATPMRQTASLVEQMFGGLPQARGLYDLVEGFIRSLGRVEVVPRRTQVGFRHLRMFAWVWLPQMWIKKQPSESITLGFGLDHRVSDRRIKQSVEPYPGRFTHHVVILRASDFDAAVRGWVREAYKQAARPGRR